VAQADVRRKFFYVDMSKESKLMEVRIRHEKDKPSVAFARFHRVVCDQPFDTGGGDTGMTPPELMLSALGCCAMHYATEYLRARHLALDKIELRISATKGGHPVRLTELAMEVNAPGLGARERAGVLKAIEGCLLHRTLADPPRMMISMVAETNRPIVPQPVDSVS
jgi:putative redox protein